MLTNLSVDRKRRQRKRWQVR